MTNSIALMKDSLAWEVVFSFEGKVFGKIVIISFTQGFFSFSSGLSSLEEISLGSSHHLHPHSVQDLVGNLGDYIKHEGLVLRYKKLGTYILTWAYLESAMLDFLAYLPYDMALRMTRSCRVIKFDSVMSSHQVIHDWVHLIRVGANSGTVLEPQVLQDLGSFAFVLVRRRGARVPLPLSWWRFLSWNGHNQVLRLDKNHSTWSRLVADPPIFCTTFFSFFFLFFLASSIFVGILTFIFPTSTAGYEAHRGSVG
ncbi:hypothetical protein FNV43_RR21721 [Rhamnella rubrinervis]|uniref:Transmembrane protein n=1 Tax=Rhamnella rubrinervis TaxID=2594499 RepID=A0A8K0GRE4_9ROSA|nr:hypothetical protein FNV43_RR21721 [Rhamnella rubrinervis]